MTARTRAARAAAALVLAGATLVGTAGCTFLTPTATLIQYDPSEGVGLTIGTVGIRNALLLPSEDGESASLVMTLFNNGDSGQEVLLQYEGAEGKTDVSVLIEADTAISFGSTPDQEQLVLEGVDAEEGSLLPVYVQYGDEPGQMLMVPVLNPNQPEYENLIPTPSPTPTPTPTPTPLIQPESPEGGADDTDEG